MPTVPVVTGVEFIVIVEGAVGVAVTVVLVAPGPTLFIGLIWMLYCVPLVKPVMVTGDAVTAGFKAIQVCPPSKVYS